MGALGHVSFPLPLLCYQHWPGGGCRPTCGKKGLLNICVYPLAKTNRLYLPQSNRPAEGCPERNGCSLGSGLFWAWEAHCVLFPYQEDPHPLSSSASEMEKGTLSTWTVSSCWPWRGCRATCGKKGPTHAHFGLLLAGWWFSDSSSALRGRHRLVNNTLREADLWGSESEGEGRLMDRQIDGLPT